MRDEEKARAERSFWTKVVSAAGTLVVGLIVFAAWGCPNYNVWQQGLAGKAELKRAEQNRQIMIQEAEARAASALALAKAKVQQAKAEADAEVIRAEGAAKANKILGESLRGNEQYLRYLWIQGLQDGSSEVIYIPTEAGLPVLEAGKR